MPYVLARLLVLLCLGLAGMVQAADPEPLPQQEAFRLAPPVYDGQAIVLSYTIAPGYYMYRQRFSFQLEPAQPLGEAVFPPGEVKDDKYMGRVETYHNSVTIRLPVTTPPPPDTTVVARSQGCADFGLCYPPYTWKLKLANASSPAVAPAGGSDLLDEMGAKKKSLGYSLSESGDRETTGLEKLLAGGHWWLIVLTFAALGFGLALTACLYPLIPIISGIILTGPSKRGRAFGLSLAYSQGVALSYALLGVLAGLTGTALTQLLQTPWALGGFAVIFIVLALSMFGLFQLQLPAALQSRLAERANRLPGGQLLTVFAMGVISSVIIGPCMAPPLAAAFVYISQTRDALTGGLALYSLGLGLGIPLIAACVFGDRLLPRAGPWMNSIRRFYGVVFLALALWIVRPVVPTAVLMVAWSLLLIGCGVFLGALEPLAVNAHAVKRLGKALGLALIVAGIALLLGFLAGKRDLLQPLRGLGGTTTQAAAKLQFTVIDTATGLDAALLAARGRPVLVDVYADWCVACHQLEDETFPDPAVASTLAGMATLKFDMTANTADQRAWLKRHRLFGPPALLLYDREGRLRRTLIGFQSALELQAALKEVQ